MRQKPQRLDPYVLGEQQNVDQDQVGFVRNSAVYMSASVHCPHHPAADHRYSYLSMECHDIRVTVKPLAAITFTSQFITAHHHVGHAIVHVRLLSLQPG